MNWFGCHHTSDRAETSWRRRAWTAHHFAGQLLINCREWNTPSGQGGQADLDDLQCTHAAAIAAGDHWGAGLVWEGAVTALGEFALGL